MSSFDKFINGENEIASMLKIIRNHLCKGEKCIEYGVVAFYSFDHNSKDKYVQTFPLNNSIVSLNFPDDVKIKSKFLSGINAKRNSDKLYYTNHFKDKFDTTDHFSIPEKLIKPVLKFNSTEINGKSWNTYFNDCQDYNILDQLFFPSGTSEFIIVPIPILYSPSILLILEKAQIENDLSKIKEFAIPISESVHHYIYNRLLTELKDDVKLLGINSPIELIEVFLRELSQIAIPISYKINEKEYSCFDWYDSKNVPEKYSEFQLKLLDDVKVEFTMPNYHWCGDGKDKKMIFDELRVEHIKETIENIFKLVHSNWMAVKRIESTGLEVFKQAVQDCGLSTQTFSIFENLQLNLSRIEKNWSKEISFRNREIILGFDNLKIFQKDIYSIELLSKDLIDNEQLTILKTNNLISGKNTTIYSLHKKELYVLIEKSRVYIINNDYRRQITDQLDKDFFNQKTYGKNNTATEQYIRKSSNRPINAIPIYNIEQKTINFTLKS